MNLNPKLKAALIVVALSSILIGGVVAAGIWVNSTNAISGTPLTPNPTPTPTPVPTASPTPTPIPSPTIISASLTANDTSGTEYIFYKGDTLHITATQNVSVSTQVQLYNFANLLETKTSNSEGVTEFFRVVSNPYNYTVKVYNP